jgi:hypothetical protein
VVASGRVGALAEVARCLARSGIYWTSAQQSIWVHGGPAEDFRAAAELLRELRRLRPASHLLLTTSDRRAASWLRERYPGHPVVPPPWPHGAARFLSHFDPAVLVRLGGDASLPRSLIRSAERRGLSIAVDEPSSRVDPEALLPLRPAAASEAPQDFHERRRFRRLAQTRLGRSFVATREGRRIPDWDSLRRRLGSPRSILCLGNGPSSEDPRVRDVPHDCLLRVNHRWADRGILTRPDMVFVGDLRTTHAVEGCVFGFRVVAKEQEVLLRHVLLGGGLAPLEHFTLERVPSLLDDRAWRANPTNGAVMVATAVMLRPERLAIAGIDLFDDPRGPYPGAPSAENDYLPGHERDVDLDVIRHALSRFDGELALLSPALHRALAS